MACHRRFLPCKAIQQVNKGMYCILGSSVKTALLLNYTLLQSLRALLSIAKLIVHIVDFFRPEVQPMHYRGSEAVATRPRQDERPKDSSFQPQSSERNRQLGSSHHGLESRNRARSGSERQHHGHSGRISDGHDESHSSRKRMRHPSPVYGAKQIRQASRHGSRSREDSSDDECNFKRRWGRRSSVSVAIRH